MSICFVDSTTLIYPLEAGAPVKAKISERWLKILRDTNSLTISPQVLNECYWVVRRKDSFARARPIIRGYLEAYSVWAHGPLNSETLSKAWLLEDRYDVQFWDALLLASASAAGCDYFLSEDLNDSQLYGEVRVVDPFRHAPEDVLGRARH